MSYNSNHGTNTKEKGKKGKAKKKAPGSSVALDRGKVYWDELPSGVERGLITAVLAQGGALMFTQSSDGGALGIRVYHDDHDTETVWGRPDDGFQETLLEITEYYENYS